MPGPTRATQCLTWVMAVLALLQSLQGSALACHLGFCHSSARSTTKTCCSKQAEPPRRDANRDGDVAKPAAPTSPCKCPSSCWCRRAPSLIAPLSDLSPLTSSDELVVCWDSALVISTGTATEVHSTVPISALHTCAVLCRFLA